VVNQLRRRKCNWLGRMRQEVTNKYYSGHHTVIEEENQRTPGISEGEQQVSHTDRRRWKAQDRTG